MIAIKYTLSPESGNFLCWVGSRYQTANEKTISGIKPFQRIITNQPFCDPTYLSLLPQKLDKNFHLNTEFPLYSKEVKGFSKYLPF